MAVSNTDSPFWVGSRKHPLSIANFCDTIHQAEEYEFDTKIGFRDIKFIVMMEKTNGGITHTHEDYA